MVSTRGVAGALLAWIAGCTPTPEAAESAGTGHTGLEDVSPLVAVHPAVRDSLLLGQPVDVLVVLDDVPLPAGRVAGGLEPWARAWSPRAERFVRELPARVVHRRTYGHLPVVVVEVPDLDAVRELARRPGVVSIDADLPHEAFLPQSLPLVNQPAAALAGFTGAGTAVAVLDTGVDYTQPDLGSCTAVNTPSTCRVVYAADTAPQDNALDADGHGTNVAGIVGGVAPGADIIALDVFTGASAWSTDILEAIDWVIANQAAYNIASINMSLGAGRYYAPCTDAYTAAIANARAAGVSVVVASGNNAYTDSISSPACSTGAFSVGAVYDTNLGGIGWSSCSDSTSAADKVTCFSNSASFLDVLAPGALITAGGRTLGGTSMAAPHVAGAMAVLRAADAGATVDELEAKLVETGTAVTDLRNGLVFKRMDVAAAVEDCIDTVSPTELAPAGDGDDGSVTITADAGCAWEVTSDAAWLTASPASGTGSGAVTWTAALNPGGSRVGHLTIAGRSVTATQAAGPGPTGTVDIAEGAVGTKATAVTLTLDAADAATMCISNTSTCTAWRAYATSLPWTLTTGVGTKTVTAWFANAAGTVGDAATDTIEYETTKPTDGTVTVAGGDASATLSWTGFADATTGVASYLVTQATGTSTPAASCTGTAVWSGADDTATLTGLTNGTKYTWRVCAVDGAGNVSTGATASLTVAPEYDGPVGTISLNAGAAWSVSRSLTASLSATDPSGVAKACLSNTTTCTTWFTMVASKTWSVTADGTATVYAWFEDTYGNRSGPISDTIGVDTVKPVNGTVAATGASGQVSLAISGFTDATSGIASYKVVQNTGTTFPATSCTATPVWTGSSSPAVITGLTDGTTYAFRVCAVDAAGQVSTGATTTGRPTPETTPPTGSIVINSDAAWSKSASVTVALTATDTSGVSRACLSNTTTCTTWFTMTASKTWTLASGAGAKTVYAKFEDTWGNQSDLVSDTISLDTTVPVNGTLTAAGDDAEATLTWSGFSDVTSGIASYKVVQSTGTATPATSCTATPVWTGTDTTTTLTGLTNGTKHTWRVCAVDGAGGVSTGVTASATPAPEYDPPTGSVSLNAGATWTNNRTVTLTVTASDASGVGRMCVGTGTTCTAWKTFAGTSTFTVATPDGTKTVKVWLEDLYGTQTPSPVTDDIQVDTTKPTNGTATAAAAATGSVLVSWSGATDGGSGLNGAKVVYKTGTAPTTCTTGTVAHDGAGSSVTVTGLVSGTSYGFRVCAKDVAGNLAVGATATAVAP